MVDEIPVFYQGVKALVYSPVELLNGEELSFRLENDLGTYELSITQESDSSLHLVSSLSIFKKRLPGEEFHQLVELEKGIERAGNGTVMVGM